MTFDELQQKALAFRDDRDWAQFHNPKDLAISINLEAAELLECFQWSGDDLIVQDKKDEMIDEIADVIIYSIYLSNALGINLVEAINDKIDANSKKYPIEKARGTSRKYTKL